MKKRFIGFLGNPWGQRISVLAVIFIVMVIFQRKFFLPSNAMSILLAISIYGIMACGMLFTVLVGGMDLSMGTMAALSASIMGSIASADGYSTGGVLLGCAAALGVCIVVGYIHGSCVTHFAMPAFVVTLATSNIINGIVQLVTEGRFVYFSGKGLIYTLGNARPLGVPMPVVIFIACALVCAFVLTKTTYGRRLYAIGGNSPAASLVGIRARANTKVAYIISSISAGLGGIILSSMNMYAGQTTANGYEGSVLMAMVVGGINLAGGEGGVTGAIFGALLVGIINNMMNLLGVSSDFQKFMQGIIILAAVSMNIYAKRRSAGIGIKSKSRREALAARK